MALADNLIAYWKLDETSGTNAEDQVASYDGTNSGAALGTDGIIGKCYDFESSEGDKVTVADAAGLDPVNFSISLWVKAESSGEANCGLFSKGTSSSDILQFAFYDTSLRPMIHLTHTTGGYKTLIADGAISTGAWHHLVVTYDGTTKRIYVDGSDVKDSTDGSGNYVGTTSDIKFGEDIGTANYDGLLDEIGFWSRALTSAEVTDLYNSGAGLTYPFSTDRIVTPSTLTLSTTSQSPLYLITISRDKLSLSLALKSPTIIKTRIYDFKSISKNFPVPYKIRMKL